MQRDLSLDLIFRVLPRTVELAPVREALLSASVKDRTRAWTGSASYTTVDKRLLALDELDRAFTSAEAAGVQHVRRYHAVLRSVLHALARGEHEAPLRELIGLGEAASESGRWEESISYYGVVTELASEYGEGALFTLAARRMGRAHLNLGHFTLAEQWYTRSLQAAAGADDETGVVIAHTGLGHVHAMQGRLSTAEQEYRLALARCPEAAAVERGQLYINLSMCAREAERLPEAAMLLWEAGRLWEQLSNADRSVWHNNQGLLLLRRGELKDARAEFERALALSPSHFDSAMIMENLSMAWHEEGRLHEAEAYARRAEDFAVACASARALAEVYVRLGCIARERRDSNGIGFFEKALTLARDNGYLWVEAHGCAEYALMRAAEGDAAEAEGLRERALEIFRELGTDPLPRSLTRG